MIGEDLFEVDGPDLFTDGDYHEAEGWRQRAAHGASSTRHFWPRAKVCMLT